MAAYSSNKSISATLVASTVDTVTLNIPYNVITVINESSTGLISFTTNGNTPTAGGNDTYDVGPNASLTVTNAARLQGESASVNGVPSVNRIDTVTVTSGSSLVLDPSIVSADAGKRIAHIPGFNHSLQGPAKVGTVVNGTSFVLTSTISNAPMNSVYTGTVQYNIHGVTTAASGSTFVPGVDPNNVLANPTIATFPSLPLVTLISAGTPSYTVIGG